MHGKVFHGKGAGRHAADRLAPRAPAAAPVVTDAVLLMEREVCMTGPEHLTEFLVIL